MDSVGLAWLGLDWLGLAWLDSVAFFFSCVGFGLVRLGFVISAFFWYVLVGL